MKNYCHCLLLGLLVAACTVQGTDKPYSSEKLVIEQVADHVYQHTSFLDAGSFGIVPCNGMVVVQDQEAVIFDTPVDDSSSLELIRWVQNELDCKIKAVIPTHFHQDCLAGLNVFHQAGIPSYAHQLTIALARAQDKVLPQHAFDTSLELTVGGKTVEVASWGEGHTRDNVVGYYLAEQVMFGGCLIKEAGAGKGNLEDANVSAWPLTVAKIKENYPEVRLVIPGHGQAGGPELLDYTQQLFGSN